MEIYNACKEDIKDIACLFTRCFADSVLHHCGGRYPKPQAMEDVFALVRDAEPEAAFLARNEQGLTVGYCFAPACLSRLWLKAVVGGYLLRWCWNWLRGRYGFGFYPLKVILHNKLAFLQSALGPSQSADARILSIAVAPEWQGQKIAQQLLEAALHYFRQKDVKRVRLEVRPNNGPAIRVYEKYGFVPGGYTADSQGKWLIMFKEMREETC